MKIFLADLNKLIFPEIYPFHKEGFRKELEILATEGTIDQEQLSAIAFKVKVTKLSVKVKPEICETILPGRRLRFAKVRTQDQ